MIFQRQFPKESSLESWLLILWAGAAAAVAAEAVPKGVPRSGKAGSEATGGPAADN